MVHAYDFTNEYIDNGKGQIIPDDTPARNVKAASAIEYCFDSVEITNGEILYSASMLKNQKSCRPDMTNAGNIYRNVYSILENVGSDKDVNSYKNSICPKGWILPVTSTKGSQSFKNLIQIVYGTTKANTFYIPLSFLRIGVFDNNGLRSSTNTMNIYFIAGGNGFIYNQWEYYLELPLKSSGTKSGSLRYVLV